MQHKSINTTHTHTTYLDCRLNPKTDLCNHRPNVSTSLYMSLVQYMDQAHTYCSNYNRHSHWLKHSNCPQASSASTNPSSRGCRACSQQSLHKCACLLLLNQSKSPSLDRQQEEQWNKQIQLSNCHDQTPLRHTQNQTQYSPGATLHYLFSYLLRCQYLSSAIQRSHCAPLKVACQLQASPTSIRLLS